MSSTANTATFTVDYAGTDTETTIKIGGIDAGNTSIPNVADPTNPQDGATKNYVDSTIKSISNADIYTVGSGSDKTIYEVQTDIYLQYDRADNTVVLYNDTANDVRIDGMIAFEVCADYNSTPQRYYVQFKSILVLSLSATYLTTSDLPFAFGLDDDQNVAFADEDLTTWHIEFLEILQYDGTFQADDTYLTSNTIDSMTIAGFTDYSSVANSFIKVSYQTTGVYEFS